MVDLTEGQAVVALGLERESLGMLLNESDLRNQWSNFTGVKDFKLSLITLDPK